MFSAEYPADHEHHGEIWWLHVTTDNLRTYSSKRAIQEDFIAWIRTVFEITGGTQCLRDMPPQTFHGCEFAYGHDNQDRPTITISMPGFVHDLLREVGLEHCNPSRTPMTVNDVVTKLDEPTTPAEQHATVEWVNAKFARDFRSYSEAATWYAHIYSSIGWITQKCAPELLFAHSVLGRALKSPGQKAFASMKKLLRCIAGNRHLSRTYYQSKKWDWRNGEFPQWSIESDASFASDVHDRKSQGGYTGGFDNQAVTTASSTKGRRVATSTFQAEIAHSCRAAKEALYNRNTLSFLHPGLITGPTPMTVDNYATYLHTAAPIRKFSPNSKQLHTEERMIIDCVENKEIVMRQRSGSLPEHPKPNDGLRADSMTKPLSFPPWDFYRRALTGQTET